SPFGEGATYSSAVISPNLETTKIMRVPHATSVSECITACCDLSGCDLSWMFEQRCYIVNCQHKENCEPKTIETVKSYLIFVLRPSQRPASLLGFGQVIPSMVHSVGRQNEPSEEVSLLGKELSLEEIPEYIDDYKDLEQDPFQVSLKHEQKENADYADWGLMVAGENGFNTSVSDNGDNQEEEAGKVKSLLSKNSSELSSVSEHSTERLSSLPEITPFPGKTSESRAAVELLTQPANALQEKVPPYSPPSDKLEFSPDVSDKAQTPTVAPDNVTEHGIMLPSNIVPSEPMQQFTPPATAAKADKVKELIVSAGDNIQVMLPKNEVELNAFVVPPPTTETSYNYEWRLISHPADYGGEMEHRYTRTLKLSHLSVGLYAFKVTVSGENAFGEGFVNVTVKPAIRVNQPPVAVASPKVQEVSLPTTSTFIDGSQSTDDMKIVSYHWEEIKGPLREQKASADTPVLHLSNLVLGNYTFRYTFMDDFLLSFRHFCDVLLLKSCTYFELKHILLFLHICSLNIFLYFMSGVRTPYLQLSAMQEGDYTFQLTVTDSARQQSTAEVTLIVQPENNSPPVAVAGPDRELTFPVESTTLDGSRSQDDQGIVLYHWENISGPSYVQMENGDKAIATVSGLQVGTYRFRLTVKDQQGLSNACMLSITVKEENNSPPRAHAGGKHVLVLPNNSVTLDGSRSADDQGIVSYLWIRDGQSPAAGDVIHGSDHEAVLQLTNLVEGIYIFHLKVTDAKGDSDIDSATVEVRPGMTIKRSSIRCEYLIFVLLFSSSNVDKILSVVFYVQNGHPSKVIKASDVSRALHVQLLKEKADFLLFKVLRVDTAACLLKCSGHGRCDPITKRCICYQLWMENLINRYLNDGESNCEWSILYVTLSAFITIVVMIGLAWFCICCCKRDKKRTKIRKKTKYTILDNIDEQERMELRPKYGIKHRSTEHNSSLMVSESEFDSDQDTIFSRERIERENPKTLMNGSVRNGVSFNYSSKDR
uniref:KIAA0319 n=1 Tax=Pavo cristatus TaxID=9049 RepID=A0A8C9G5U9_PAVCR